MVTAKDYLMSDEELSAKRAEFIADYFHNGQFTQTPYGAGYWICEHEKTDNSSLCEECDDSERFADTIPIEVFNAWRQNQPLPPRWFIVGDEVAGKVFDTLVKKYGQSGIDEIDLPRVDEALQIVLLGELRYG